MFKFNNKDTKNHANDVTLGFMLTLNTFHTISGVSIMDFEQVNLVGLLGELSEKVVILILQTN